MAGVTEKSIVRVQLSPDRLKAFLVFQPESDYAQLSPFDIHSALAPFHVRLSPEADERIANLLKDTAKGRVPTEPYLVVEGTPPVNPTDQEFVWDDRYTQKSPAVEDHEAVNFYEQHKIVTVEADTIIGRITPSKPGRDGVDVCGNPIKPGRLAATMRLGENVRFEPDGRTVRAVAAGQVILQKHKICIRRTLEIEGNVDFETGNIDSATDVCVRGAVRDLFIVRSKHDIAVQGMVEAACLSAEGDITIVGGVKGREKALLEAGGGVSAKFLNFVYMQAGGDVEICKECIDSTVICDGWLDIANGSLIAGQAFGLKGAEIKSLGSPAGVKTVVGVGLNPVRYGRALELEQGIRRNKELAQKIRASVGSLLQQLKRLTPEQKEKATELMFHADSLDLEIKQMEEERTKLLSTFPAPTEVELKVGGRILPNTQIFVGDRFSTFHEEVKGPVKVVQRSIDGKRELLLINCITGSSRTLMAGRLDAGTLSIPAKPQITQPGSKTLQNN